MTLETKRKYTFILVIILLLLAYPMLRSLGWRGSTNLHTIMEVIATLLALFVGVLSLLRYHTNKSNQLFLLIGVGFFGTAFLDGYHAVVTSVFFAELFPSMPSSLIPWSWIASRLFLSIFLFWSYIHFRYSNENAINEKHVYLFVSISTLVTFVFFAFVPLPNAYYPELIMNRPEELLPALFFSLALYGYIVKGNWKNDTFEYWLTLSLIVSVISQIIFMSFSEVLFDMQFDAAHLLKKVSYILVLTGLLKSIYKLVLNEKIQQAELIQKTYELNEAQKLAKLGVWTLDHKSNLLVWDDETYNMFERSIDDKLESAQEFWEFIHKDDLDALKEIFIHHLTSTLPFIATHRIVTTKGNVKYLKEQCTTTFDEDKNPLFSRGVVQDVTLEVIQQQQFIQQSKLAQLGEMISMIAHQWRQPLAAISMTAINMKVSLEVEEYDLKDENERKKCVNDFNNSVSDIENLTQSLTKIINDFRDFYKPSKSAKNILIREPIIKALNIIKESLKLQSISVKEEFHETKSLDIFESEIMQVFLNILKNSEENFNLNKNDNAEIIINTKDTENGVEVNIIDNGGGIDSEILPKIFEPYFSTKSQMNGVGLGLYMAKMIIDEHHKGKLSAENTDNGVMFKIELYENII